MLGLLPNDIGLLVSVSDPRLSPDASRVAFSVVRIDLENNRYHSRVWVAATDLYIYLVSSGAIRDLNTWSS